MNPLKSKRANASVRVSLVAGMLLVPLALVVGAGNVAAACGDPLDVQVDGDACATTLAVSATGDARGSRCMGVVSCVAVSGTGNAENTGYEYYAYGNTYGSCGHSSYSAVSCIAVSGTGSATNTASGGGNCGYGYAVFPILLSPRLVNIGYPSAGCIAASGTGDATNNAGSYSCAYAVNAIGCIAVSGQGDATNNVGDPNGGGQSCGSKQSGDLVNIGCIAASGTGNAENNAPANSCGQALSYGAGIAIGCIAASGTGDARNHVGGRFGGAGSCGNNQGPTIAIGCVAVSGLGDASNDGEQFTNPWSGESSGPCGDGWDPSDAGGIGVSCIAVSGGGSASNTIDGEPCETHIGAFGNSEAIRCVAVSPGSLPSPVAGPSPLLPSSASGWTFERVLGAAQVVATESSPAAGEVAPWWAEWFATLQGWFHSTFGGA